MNDEMKTALSKDLLNGLETVYDQAKKDCPSRSNVFGIRDTCEAQPISETGVRSFCTFDNCPFVHFAAAMVLNSKFISMTLYNLLSMNAGGLREMLKPHTTDVSGCGKM
jgi:hypothetical protein